VKTDASGRRRASVTVAESQRRLDHAVTVSELFAITSALVVERYGFERAVVLDVGDDVLTAETTARLPDASSDDLRRQVLAEPVEVEASSLEAQLIRDPGRQPASGTSTVAVALQLDKPVFVPIVVEDRAVALLVADRPARDVVDDIDDMAILAHVVGLTVVVMVLKTRLHEFATELRHLTVSATALVQEALGAPMTLPRDQGQGFVFTYPAVHAPARGGPSDDRLFTAREEEIMRLVAAGLSNREIAEQINLSVETVKGYVKQLFRKLGAQNRVDASVRYLKRTGDA